MGAMPIAPHRRRPSHAPVAVDRLTSPTPRAGLHFPRLSITGSTEPLRAPPKTPAPVLGAAPPPLRLAASTRRAPSPSSPRLAPDTRGALRPSSPRGAPYRRTAPSLYAVVTSTSSPRLLISSSSPDLSHAGPLPFNAVSEPPPLLICASLAHAPPPPRPVTSLRSCSVVHHAALVRAHPRPARAKSSPAQTPPRPPALQAAPAGASRPSHCRPRPPPPAPDLGNRRACLTPRTGRGLAQRRPWPPAPYYWPGPSRPATHPPPTPSPSPHIAGALPTRPSPSTASPRRPLAPDCTAPASPLPAPLSLAAPPPPKTLAPVLGAAPPPLRLAASTRRAPSPSSPRLAPDTRGALRPTSPRGAPCRRTAPSPYAVVTSTSSPRLLISSSSPDLSHAGPLPFNAVSEPPPLLICASLAHAPPPPRPVTSLRSRSVVHRAALVRAHPRPARAKSSPAQTPPRPPAPKAAPAGASRPSQRPRPPPPAPDLGNRRACLTPRTGRDLAQRRPWPPAPYYWPGQGPQWAGARRPYPPRRSG
nr:basic proline-rich protein-like [Aegilops tauschii subsp. strangulata]